jgi:L,D-transpeptidase YcbB
MRNQYLPCAGRVSRRAHGPLFLSALAAALTTAALPAPAAAQGAPNMAAALRSADGGTREIRTFYRANGYRPLWTRGGMIGQEADALLSLIATADADGLDPGEYRIRSLEEAIDRARTGDPRALARAEMMLSRAYVDYARDTRRPRDVGMHWVDREVMPRVPTAPSLLTAAAQAPSLQQFIAQMGWMHPVYAQLRRAVASQGSNWTDGLRVPVPAGPPLRIGDRGYRVEILRQRLGLEPDDLFDEEADAALRQFQRDRGMQGDGILGPRTLAALNGDRERVGGDPRLLRLNLERARVLPAASSGRHVLVDAASQRLWLYENGRVVDSMKVIVGKPTEQTPMMAGLIRFASVNPYWNIPPDLVRKRIVPQVAKGGPGALRGRYQVVSDFSPNARVIDPANVDWQAVASGQVDLPVRQLPGGDNAMGRVKYMFPNELGIYLHDTPERNLFGKAERRFSSGCVRVEDASRLGQWLFGRPLPVKTKSPEQQVNLPRPVPVYITYLTAAPEGSQIVFRSDAYGRDAVQMAALSR